ncbi:hypothetical protein Tco_0269119 [Tanacetum coccineum]
MMMSITECDDDVDLIIKDYDDNDYDDQIRTILNKKVMSRSLKIQDDIMRKLIQQRRLCHQTIPFIPQFFHSDDEARKDEEVNEEDSFDPRVHTPSHVESTDDDESDEEIQGANVEGEEMDKEETNEEEEVNELYRDVNVNLEERDTEMTNAPITIVQCTQVTEDTHVIITALVNPEGQQQSSSVSSGFVSNMLNPSLDIGIDSIFNLNTESTSLVDVPVTTIVETPLSSTTTLPPTHTPLISHLQKTPVPTPTTIPSSSLQDLLNFGSLFGFDHKLKTLENDFSEFKQMNPIFCMQFSQFSDIKR